MGVFNYNGEEITDVYAVDGDKLSHVYTMDGTEIPLEPSPPTHSFFDTAVCTLLGSISASGIKQGGCTDGEYIYQTSGDSSGYSYMQIVKYKISDGTYTITRYDTNIFGHANGMAYNPNTGYLYVATMKTDGSVVVVDPSDMSVAETKYMYWNGNPMTVWQIAYDRIGHRFVATQSGNFLFFDDNFQYIGSVPLGTGAPTATGQDCGTDGGYIYQITYNPNNVEVYTLADGTHVKSISVSLGGEPETIMYNWDADEFYITRESNSGTFYKAELYNA